MALALVFVCIVLHELGHALVARRFHIPVYDILLLPFGGLARLERLPDKPLQEMWIALAGPAVNALLAVVSLPVLFLWVAPSLSDSYLLDPRVILNDFIFLLPFFFALNVGLATFNLLPAFPMDGGRVLRALLALRWGRYRSTIVATAIGWSLALALAIYGIAWGHLSYLFIAAFIFYTALAEMQWVKQDHLLNSNPVTEAMVNPIVVEGAGEAVKKPSAEEANQPKYIVLLVEGMPVGVRMARGTWPDGNDLQTKYSSTDALPLLSPHQSLREALTLLRKHRLPALPVMYDGRLLGVIGENEIETWLKRKVSLPTAKDPHLS